MAHLRHHPRPDSDLTIMFEHCSNHGYFPDRPSPSGRSSPSNSSPSTPIEPYSPASLDLAVASEDSWNLIPYDVPWGCEYYHYRAGTLPGPDGACIFLRSPTPLKNRRTQKACNKCRQRKAKCSGSRPACNRCLARGYICEYVEEDKPARPQQNASRQPRDRRLRSDSECSEPAGPSYPPSEVDSSPYHYAHAKSENSGTSTPDLLYSEQDSHMFESTASPAEFASQQWEDAQYAIPTSFGYDNVHHEGFAAEQAAMADYYEASSSAYAHAAEAHPAPEPFHDFVEHHAPAAVHAPRPVRCLGSPTFLTPEQRLDAFGMRVDAHGMHHNPMLVNLASAAADGAPHIALPQVPPMQPSESSLSDHGMDYAPHQDAFYYAADAGHGMPAYPYLHYSYGVPAYPQPDAHPQEVIEPTMLYTMPMLSAGMTA
ncbi:uncharacterized protein BXZ73DRAFT_47582 [Epithele typhae]|uniref:uncharacterized protein n=1 Tax=Epithele typhae TaxID=378194 RepID=UPI0020078431|nr:uncharacterized protein BXZ73DRAFT_47582 [Epithele typhae]KAH9930462.1 hypothetical protein BXZ73DRAFT_47582 [Epithele typhae]